MAAKKSAFWGNVRRGMKITAKQTKQIARSRRKKRTTAVRKQTARRVRAVTVGRRGNLSAVVTPSSTGNRWRVLATGRTYASFGEAKANAIKTMNQIYMARRKKGRR